MKILVYGAGVLGSLYAARLYDAGHEVSILARGQRLADIRQYGIVLCDETTGQETVSPVPAVDGLAPEDAYDWVLVIMRKNQVAEILPELAANQHTPNILFLVNNAAGPEALVKALGRERVLLGFVGAGGAREEHVVRYILTSGQETTFGELDGQTTPRLEQLDAALKSAGFETDICSNMDAWLKTHVALVSPIANALYAAGGDNYRLARTPDALLLLIRALREGLRTLKSLGIPITPAPYRVLAALPEPLLLVFLRRLLDTHRSELLMARHANAARDEMQTLADEFRALAQQAGADTPAIHQLYQYLDPTVPPIPDGSQQMQPRWQELWPVALAVGIIIGFVAVLRSPGKRS